MPKVGRPSGPSPEISKELDKIADLIVRNKAKSANNAMVQVIALRPQKENSIDPDSARQSLHRWWRRQKTERLDEARNRYQEKMHSRSTAHSVSLRDTISVGNKLSNAAASLAHLGIQNPSIVAAVAKLEAQKASIRSAVSNLNHPELASLIGAAAAFQEQGLAAQSAVDRITAASKIAGINSIASQLADGSLLGQMTAAQKEIDRMEKFMNPLGH